MHLVSDRDDTFILGFKRPFEPVTKHERGNPSLSSAPSKRTPECTKPYVFSVHSFFLIIKISMGDLLDGPAEMQKTVSSSFSAIIEFPARRTRLYTAAAVPTKKKTPKAKHSFPRDRRASRDGLTNLYTYAKEINKILRLTKNKNTTDRSQPAIEPVSRIFATAGPIRSLIRFLISNEMNKLFSLTIT